MSLKFHPDKNNGEPFFESMFKSINEANEILTNDNKRANYDFQLRKFNESKNDSASQKELKRKEEELRRKQEELFKREQELKRQKFSSESETNSLETEAEIDWGKVVNFFVVLNIFLVILIFSTTHKNDRSTTNSSILPVNKTNDQKSIDGALNYKEPKDQHKFLDTVENDADYVVDTTSVTQTFLAPPTENEVDAINIDLKNTETIGDSLGEKPKWIQFKKRREWKRKEKDMKKN